MTGRTETALILIDHGSRVDEANRLLEKVAHRLTQAGDYRIVEIAHMELAPPTLADAFDACVKRGAVRVIITPFFLAMGRHMTEDIPRMAREAAAAHPEVQWILAEPLLLDERIVQVLLDRAKEAAFVAWPETK